LEGHLVVRALAFSPDGACLASSGDFFDNGVVRLWNVNDGRCTRYMDDWRLHDICSIAFSPDGRTLAAAGNNFDDGWVRGAISFWGLSNDIFHTCLDTRFIASTVETISYSPDGRYLASLDFTWDEFHDVRLWNAEEDHSCVAVLEHSAKVKSVAFSPNSKILASGSNDGIVRLWSVETKSIILLLPNCHVDFFVVGSVAFSPDGQTLASGGAHRDVHLWNPHEEKNRDKRVDWKEVCRLWNAKAEDRF
jgi:WD40 repeat protein